MEFNWKAVCFANAEINRTTVDVSDECSIEVLDAFDHYGSNVVIRKSLTKAIRGGMNPTECLHDYLNTVLGDSARYAFYGTDEIEEIVSACLEYGAEFPYDRLFEKRCEETLEEEVADYHVRGFLIDILKPACCAKYANWEGIVARDWEEIELPEDSDLPDEIRYSVLKHNSEYLKSIE